MGKPKKGRENQEEPFPQDSRQLKEQRGYIIHGALHRVKMQRPSFRND